jgi:hypothetical protein
MARIRDNPRSPPAGSQQPPLDAELDHPLGTTVGAAAGGAAAGAAAGTVAGPVGTALGAAAGALVGAMAGKVVAHTLEAYREDDYWSVRFLQQPYVPVEAHYADYGPAYRYGAHARSQYGDRRYEDVLRDLERGWEEARSDSRLTWQQAEPAVRDGWQRCADRLKRPREQAP